MKKIIKSTVTSFLVFWLAACSNTDKPEIIPDRFKNFMNIYFHGYIYEYKDINARGNHNYGEQYALFEIKKNDLDQGEMKMIFNQLAQNGWRVIESNDKNFISFCYGNNFSLDILFPLKKYEVTPSGVPIKFNEMDNWNIFLYKSTTTIAACS
ncbi:MAG: hypothetical protein I4N51_25070 [Acinetobacter sp.]|uniref:Uncharacterized protein n=1 Tax=Acinetobacter guillouiae TaxID=106649 RepID=A0A8X8KEM3_ACIGI|nr:hypothetical protein [Acinetobacter guillouiae]MBK5649909.1 hypothetical protein [Acinetobacter sp.]MCF0264020.1 hypothetical protein [Acinetobacter guillouiae]